MLYPGDMDLGSDPFALPELPAEWSNTQVAAPQVEVAPVAPLESVVPPPAPVEELTFAPDDMAQPAAPVDTFDADMAQPAADYEFAPDDFSQPLEAEPDNEFINSMLAEEPADPIEAEIARQESLTPEQWSADQIRSSATAAQDAADARIESLDAREQEAQDAYFDRKAARASTDRVLAGIQARREELAKTGVNPNGWADSLTGGQSLAAGIFAIVSGITASRTGDKSGINAITSMIDQNIDMQKDALKRQADLLDTQEAGALKNEARLDEDFKELETQRLAAYDVADQRLAAEQVKFDQVGTTAAAIMRGRLEIRQSAAAAAIKLEEHTLKMELDRTKLAREKVALKKDMRPAGKAGPSISEQLAADKAGYKIVNGALVPKQPGEVVQPLDPQERKAAADANEAEGRLIVRDAISGKEMGRADNADKATVANDSQKAWHVVERNLKRMETLEREIGMTVDNRLLRGSANDARVAEYRGLRKQLAVAVTKLDDPGSVVSPKEAEATADARLPNFNTATGEGPETAAGKRKALRDAGRAKVKAAMTAANIPFDPKSYYNDEEAPDATPAQSALKAAGAYRPVQPADIKGGPATVDSEGRVTQGNIGKKYLLNDVQVSAPIKAMEGMASAGDDKATSYLQAIAADDMHPGADLAAEALARLGAK